MFFVDSTTRQKFTKVGQASLVMRVAERAFGYEVKWSAPTSPRILEAVLIEMAKLVVPVTNRLFSSTPVVLHLDVMFCV